MRQTDRYLKFDWISIFLYLGLVCFGWFNIYSSSVGIDGGSVLDFYKPYGKQLMFIGFALVLIILLLSLEAKFYERFASVFFIISMLSLLGLFVFGKTVSGATSWYGLGSISIQPSEFAKAATALAIAKLTSGLQTDLKSLKSQVQALMIIGFPALLILLQNDTGSTLVYMAFFFVLYREGLPQVYLVLGLSLTVIAVLSLKLGVFITTGMFIILTFIIIFRYFKKIRLKGVYLMAISLLVTGYSGTVHYVYNHLLKPHQHDRISLWLRLEKDPLKLAEMERTYAYNLLQAEKAISSGGFKGTGFMEGTRTIGNFVPEQHTDYIFTTIGEEWGFLGSATVVLAFVFLIMRLIILAERQKNPFSRAYGYGVAAILFFHFFVNVGMVMGLVPTVGIPLPFFSYGGSALWGFTILLFIFLKLDSNKINEW